MIGAIDAIEKKFAVEIESDPEFRNKFMELRKEILDLGNIQIRLFKKEKEDE